MTTLPPPTVPEIADTLATVDDPELGLDIVSLGLIYAIEVAPGLIIVDMTVTSSACPMAGLLLDLADTALGGRFPGSSALLRLAADPPWDIRMCSRDALEALGVPAGQLASRSAFG